MKIATLTLEMAADVARLRRDMDHARKTIDSAMGGITQAANFAKGALGGLFAGFSVVAVLGKVSSVQREFDVLNSSLITVTGSSAKAAKEFAWIQEFAATTPFQLNEVTSAFTKMKALGLDASASSLQAYGNTASAMGKGLNQMIEAVADASTGEFERLKEFGIKANKEGDRVKLTFQGLSTSIGNNAQEITQYLQAIGNNQFAGAMSLRAQTLDGAISNLADTWDGLFRAVSSQGVGSLIYDSVKLATGVVTDLTNIIKSLSVATAQNAQDTGLMASVQNGLATVFETVAVMGVNLKYVLVSIGREIGGIAAQAAAVLTLDFSAAKAIGAAMREDAQRAAEQLEANERRISSARAIAKSLEGASGLDDPVTRRARASAEAAEQAARAAAIKEQADAQAKAAAAVKAKELALRAAEAAAKQYQGVLDGLTRTNIAGQIAAQGFTGAQAKFLEMAESPEWAKYSKTQQAQIEALYKVQIGQEQSAQAVKAHQQAQEEATKAYLDGIKALDSSAQSALERLQTMRQEDEALALSTKLTISLEAATMQLSIARLQDQQVQSMGNEAAVLALEKEIKTRKEILALIGGRDAVNAAKKAAEESEKLRTSEQAEWQKTWDQVSQSFTDALMKGGKSVAQYLKDLFRTLVLRPILEPIGKGFAGALGGGFGGGSGLGSIGGGGGLLDGLGLGSGIASAITGGLSAGFGGLMGSIGGLFGAAGTGATLGGALSAGSIALSAGNIVAGLSTLAGALGPIGIGVALLSKAFGRGPKVTQASGISGEFSAGGADLQNFTDWTRKGGWFRSNKSGTDYGALSAETDQFFDSSVRSLSSAARAYAQVLGMTGDAINDVTQTVRIDLKGLDEAAQQKAIQEAFVGFGDLLAQHLGVQSLEALEALASSLTSVNQVLASLGQSGFGASIAGAQGSQSLAALFGGVQQFAQSASAYLATYFSEAERTALTTQQLTQQFAALGLAMPEGTAGLRALIEAQDKNTESGLAAYAALLQLAPAFAGVANAAEAAAASQESAAREAVRAASELAESIADEMLRATQARINAAVSAQKALAQATDADLDLSLERVRRSIDFQKSISQSALDSARSQAQAIRSVFALLDDQVSQLFGDVQSSRASLAQQGQGFIDAALASVKAGGALPGQDQLSRAISQVGAGINSTAYATQADSDFARLVFANQLNDLKTAAGDQLSGADALVALGEAQLKALDAQLEAQQSQLNALRGIDTSMLSVSDAIARLTSALTGAAARAPEQWVGNTYASKAGAVGVRDGAGFSIQSITGAQFSAAEAVAFVNSKIQTGDIMAVYTAALQHGISAASLDGLMGWAAGTSNQWARQNNLPEFAVGTNYVPHDMFAKIHKGEAIVPAAYNPAANGTDPRKLEQLMNELAKKVGEMTDRLDAIKDSTEQFADQFDRVSAGGNALATEALA